MTTSVSILIYPGFRSGATASILLRKYPKAKVISTSKSSLLHTLQTRMKPAQGGLIFILGLGSPGPAKEGRSVLEPYFAKGCKVIWYTEDYVIDWVKSFRHPQLIYYSVKDGSMAKKLMQVENISASAELRTLEKSIRAFSPRRSESHSMMASWMMSQVMRYFRYGDKGKAYIEAVRHLGMNSNLDEKQKREAESFRKYGEWELVGNSGKSHSFRDSIIRIGSDPGGCRVLIMGESGTGKELVAHYIHDCSPRSGDFVAINCANFSPQLVDSELFGHSRGAFTGAISARKGKFQEAHGGTLFLDEVGELPLDVQSKLLRVLQTGLLTPIGTNSEEAVDVRIVAATNRDLPALVRNGEFREDLYYRLAQVKVATVPLRKMAKEDIQDITWKILYRATAVRAGFSDFDSARDLEAICSYDWPGNVRQLENVIVQSIVMGKQVDEVIEEEKQISLVQKSTATLDMGSLKERTAAICRQVLEEESGNKSKAARALDIALNTLKKHLQ